MDTKESTPQEEAPQEEKSTLVKIAETIGEVAAEISVKKDQITDMASNAVDAVKAKIHDITAPKAKAIKKAAKPVVKKATPKKVVKATAKKVNKKVVKPVTKKIASVKK